MDDIDNLIETVKERLQMASNAQEFINSLSEDKSNSMRVERKENLPLEDEETLKFIKMKVYSEEIVSFYTIKRGIYTDLYIEILGKNLGQTKMYFTIRSVFEER